MTKTTFAELLTVPLLRRRIEDLQSRLAADPEAVVPWVGAGMSARFGMPLWSSFIRDVIAEMPEEDRAAANHLRIGGFYDLAADFAHLRIGRADFDAFMVRWFNRPFDHTKAHPIARLHPRLVVTTNYDRVIDQTMPWLVPLLPGTFRSNAFRDEDVLLKLHGTIEAPDSWVLTRYQYATAYREDLWNELRELFANRTVLFIGCSLGADLYLDVLRNMRPEVRARHYAILHVASDEEATARGRALGRLGIAVIPYIAEDGDHAIVDRILEKVRPSQQKTLSYVDRLRASGNYERAMRVLAVQAASVTQVLARTRVAVKMAEVLQDFRVARPDRSTWSTDWVVSCARTAAELGTSSEMVTGVAADIFRLAGRSDPELEQRLEELRKPSASGSVSSTKDAGVLLAYSMLREGDANALQEQIKRISRRFEYGAQPGVTERLAIMRVRALLALGSDEAAHCVEHLPQSVRPFGEALLAFACNGWVDTLAALDVLDRRWRASSYYTRRPGLVFSLSLRTLATLGLEDFRAAADAASRAVAAHDPNARKAARLFRKGVPSELCYDIRRLGSSELVTILRCHEWITAAVLRDDADGDDLELLRELVARLESEKSADRLLRWYWVLFAQLSPDSAHRHGELQRTFDDLMREMVKKHDRIMLNEVALLFRAADRTVFRESIPRAQVEALGHAGSIAKPTT